MILDVKKHPLRFLVGQRLRLQGLGATNLRNHFALAVLLVRYVGAKVEVGQQAHVIEPSDVLLVILAEPFRAADVVHLRV